MSPETRTKAIFNSPFFFWLLLAIPSVGMIAGALDGSNLERLLHPTGEFSARFMIISMMLTPLRMLFPKSGVILWLMRRRRHLGVAAFGYALLHTAFYVIDLGSTAAILSDAMKVSILTGWLAFLIFVPLAITSSDRAIHKMGPRKWKTLQRMVYGAAVLTLAHWLLVSHDPGGALVHFLPLAALEAWRIWHMVRPTGSHRATRSL